MTHQRVFFSTFVEMPGSTSVSLRNNQNLPIYGKGVVEIKRRVNETWENDCMKNVLYVPNLKKNLFSEGIVTNKATK